MTFLDRLLALFGKKSVSVSVDLPGFGEVTQEEIDESNRKDYMDETPKRLKRICDSVVADPYLVAVDQGDKLKTFCNLAVYRICRQFASNNDFDGLLANQIYDYCATSPRWSKVDGPWAAEYALSGGLAIAAQKAKGHGHVAVVYPAPMLRSPSWGKDVPVIANVGKTNGIMACSRAFKDEPDFYVLKQDRKGV